MFRLDIQTAVYITTFQQPLDCNLNRSQSYPKDHGILNIISIDRINRRLTNALVYLLVYLLKMYYISGRFNYIPDVLSYFYAINDDIVCKNIIEPVLDVL